MVPDQAANSTLFAAIFCASVRAVTEPATRANSPPCWTNGIVRLKRSARSSFRPGLRRAAVSNTYTNQADLLRQRHRNQERDLRRLPPISMKTMVSIKNKVFGATAPAHHFHQHPSTPNGSPNHDITPLMKTKPRSTGIRRRIFLMHWNVSLISIPPAQAPQSCHGYRRANIIHLVAWSTRGVALYGSIRHTGVTFLCRGL